MCKIGIYMNQSQLAAIEQAKAIAQFDKRCLLLDISQCAFLPDLSELFLSPPWSDTDLQKSKQDLNAVKSRLDDMPSKEWERAASQANRAEDVKHALRKKFQAELCTVAWAKMYESIAFCNLLPPDCQALGQASDGNPFALTVHLCEAPGAFIAATNHYIRTHRPTFWWDWVAISLNPHFEGNDQFQMIDDDKLINETMANWCWGEDSSGDLRRIQNIEFLWEDARRRMVGADGESLCPGAMLVTADGAVDTSMDPNRQEEICAGLHFCEIVAAVGILAPGGSFIWKGFTLFEAASINSLYLMGCLFNEVAVYKPATSKPANSETYVVGRGFKGIDSGVMEMLKSKVSAEDMFKSCSLFSKSHIEASGGFMASAKTAAISFSKWQQDSIIEALDRHSSKSSMLTFVMKETQKWFSEYWLRELNVIPLDRSLFLAPHADLDGRSNNSSEAAGKKRKLEGTLAERQEQFKKRSTAIAGPGSKAASMVLKEPTVAVKKEEEEGGGGKGGIGLGMKAEDEPQEQQEPPPPSDIPSMNPAVLAMMKKMGHTAGQGLGSDGRQGSAQVIEVKGNKLRAGLGAEGYSKIKEAAETQGIDWTLQPSTKWLTNDRVLNEGWEPVLGIVPPRITKSKTIPDDEILSELIALTYKAHEHENEAVGGPVKKRVCGHRSPLDPVPSEGCCLAPRRGGIDQDPHHSDIERGWFKIGALDVSLSIIAEARLLMHPPRPGYERKDRGWGGPPNLFLLNLGTKHLLQGAEGSRETRGGDEVKESLSAKEYVLSAVTGALGSSKGRAEASHHSEVTKAWKERSLSIPSELWSKLTGDPAMHPLHSFYTVDVSSEICSLVGGGVALAWTTSAALVVGDLSSLRGLIPSPAEGVRPLEVEHNALYRKQLLFESLTGLM
jgi:cap2 methyltransferase